MPGVLPGRSVLQQSHDFEEPINLLLRRQSCWLPTQDVFPRICELYAGEDVVYVQHDGAPGHTGKKTPELLAEAGRKRTHGAVGALADRGENPRRAACQQYVLLPGTTHALRHLPL